MPSRHPSANGNPLLPKTGNGFKEREKPRTLFHMLKDEVIGFLKSHRLRLDTDAGQHFLVDEGTLDEIVAAAELSPKDSVLEIGPGIGILTRELLKRAGHVTAVEIDPRFPPLIRSFCEASPRLTISEGNALRQESPPAPYKVVANIPYHITSPLLHHLLLEVADRPVSITLLIQREVAENIVSSGSDSILTVLVGLFGKAELTWLVPPSAFIPAPKVDSAVLHINCHPKPKADPETAERILRLAKHAMHQRRKMLRNTIGSLEGGAAALEKVGISPDRRPQTVTVDEWIALEATLRAMRA